MGKAGRFLWKDEQLTVSQWLGGKLWSISAWLWSISKSSDFRAARWTPWWLLPFWVTRFMAQAGRARKPCHQISHSILFALETNYMQWINWSATQYITLPLKSFPLGVQPLTWWMRMMLMPWTRRTVARWGWWWSECRREHQLGCRMDLHAVMGVAAGWFLVLLLCFWHSLQNPGGEDSTVVFQGAISCGWASLYNFFVFTWPVTWLEAVGTSGKSAWMDGEAREMDRQIHGWMGP